MTNDVAAANRPRAATEPATKIAARESADNDLPVAHRRSCPEQRMVAAGAVHAGWRVARCVGCDAVAVVPVPHLASIADGAR